MALTRTVPIPLNESPALIWGLRLEDLPLVGAAVVFDLAIWRSGGSLADRIGMMALGSSVGATLAWARIEERTLWRWGWVIVEFYRRPRQYRSIGE